MGLLGPSNGFAVDPNSLLLEDSAPDYAGAMHPLSVQSRRNTCDAPGNECPKGSLRDWQTDALPCGIESGGHWRRREQTTTRPSWLREEAARATEALQERPHVLSNGTIISTGHDNNITVSGDSQSVTVTGENTQVFNQSSGLDITLSASGDAIDLTTGSVGNSTTLSDDGLTMLDFGTGNIRGRHGRPIIRH
jgi:hypothetical protein